jgi:hypothetical protein
VRQRGGSTAGLRAGDILTARQLLEGLLLPSGCDAALALAGAYGPGWRAFVRKMNATARALGMRGPDGPNRPRPIAEQSRHPTVRPRPPGRGADRRAGSRRHVPGTGCR